MTAVPSLIIVINGLFIAVSLIGRRSRLLTRGETRKFITELKLWLEVRLPSTLRVPIAPEESLKREMKFEVERWDLGEVRQQWDLYDLDRGFRWTFPSGMENPEGSADFSVLPFDPAQGVGQAEIVLVVARLHRAKTQMTKAVLAKIMERNIRRLKGAIGYSGDLTREGFPSGPIVHCDIIEEVSSTATADDLLGMIKASVRRLSERTIHGPITIVVQALSAKGKGAEKEENRARWTSADVRRLLGYIVLDEELALHRPTIVIELDMDASNQLFADVRAFLTTYLEGPRVLIERLNKLDRTIRRFLSVGGEMGSAASGPELPRGPTWALRLFTTEMNRSVA